MDNSNANFVFWITKVPPPRSNPFFVDIYFDGSKIEFAKFVWKRETNPIHISYLYIMSTILCCVPLAGAEIVMKNGEALPLVMVMVMVSVFTMTITTASSPPAKTSFPVSPIKWHLLANCENNGDIFPLLHWVESKRDREHWLDWMIVCKDWISGWSSEQLDITWVKFGSEQAKAKANSLDAFKVPWFGVPVSR